MVSKGIVRFFRKPTDFVEAVILILHIHKMKWKGGGICRIEKRSCRLLQNLDSDMDKGLTCRKKLK